jgi:hypothetical protein
MVFDFKIIALRCVQIFSIYTLTTLDNGVRALENECGLQNGDGVK